MKHILIYGPPAAGKLSIGTELAKLTDYGLLHNHLTVDLVSEIFDFGHPEFSRLVIGFRTQMIEAAAKAKVDGIISTLVYSRPGDDSILKQWVATVKRQGGQTCFVRLMADEKTLLRRVPARSRKLHKKIATSRQLKDLLHRMDVTSAIPGYKSMEIDTTKTTPKAAALRIKKQFGL